jgi:phage shock protein E
MDPTTLGILVFAALALALVVRKVLARRRFAALQPRIEAVLAAGAPLVDVRTEAEFASGHLPRARNFPLDGLERNASRIGRKDRPVVLYCASGARSMAAARILRGMGFQEVLDIGPMAMGERIEALKGRH